LVAGAEPSIRQLLRTVLEIGGFEVREASSHAEVIGCLAASERLPQVVILDVLLPTFSALTTLAYLRREARLAHLPVVILTSFADPPEHQQFLQCGASAVITKPFSSQRLLNLVSQYATAH
jgi:CheY-like chemotaxis protein